MLMVTQLAGFDAGFRTLSTLSQVLSATSAASTITLPGGILASDLIVLLDYATNSSGLPTSVTPVGFTNLTNTPQTGGIRRVMVSAKIADGTEGGTSITGMNGTSQNRKGCLIFRGDAPPATVTGGGGTFEFTLNAPTNQAQNVSGFAVPVVVLAMYASTGSVTTRGMSPAKDGEISQVSNQWYLAWKIYNTSPANTTISQSDDGSNGMFSSFFQAT
jgi:hypothetical protein